MMCMFLPNALLHRYVYVSVCLKFVVVNLTLLLNVCLILVVHDVHISHITTPVGIVLELSCVI